MKRLLLTLACVSLAICLNAQTTLKTDGLSISLDKKLQITSIIAEKDYLPEAADPSYLISIKSGENILYPQKTKWDKNIAIATFPEDIEVHISCLTKDKYLRFEIFNIKNADKIDVLFYGPFKTILDATVGEIVGVVRENNYAIGIQSLNAKTTGGQLNNPDGSDPARGTTATTEEHGSSLQAYCINRDKPRVYNIWNNKIPNAVIPANPDGNLKGSAIALFGCPEDKVLDALEHIELSENLPRSTLNGVWSKRSVDANKPYFITTFTEENIDEVLNYTEKLGFNAVYHSHPFANWGHFDLIPKQFPSGWDGMKDCADKGRARGIRVGVHVLTNFITTGDRFVSPAPDKNLMTYCQTTLTRDVDSDDKEIYIDNPEGYGYKDSNQAIRIGDEIIRFNGVSEENPYRLLNCKRGQYKTTAESYKAGDIIARLVDHPYKVFFPNFSMQKRMITNLSDFFNHTGVGQMDFDGHEGGWGTGEGEFGMDYFSEQFQKEVAHEVRNGSSRSNHFYWHTVSYINWGEPWYGGFTKSQGHYRYKNQALLIRNYIPNMLGWFLLNPTTTLQEFEYMLARSAGYNAGYALYSDIKSFKANKEFDQIAEATNIWEEARLKKIFNEKQLKALQDVNNDFSLKKIEDNKFELQYYDKLKFELLNEMVQPGQPNDVSIEFDVKEKQDLYLVMGVVGEEGTVNKINFEVNGFEEHSVEFDLGPNWAITYRGDNKILIYDEVGRLKTKIDIDSEGISLNTGSNTIRVSAEFEQGTDIKLGGYVRLKSKIEEIEY